MKTFYAYCAAVSFVAILGIVGKWDAEDAKAAEAHKRETIAAMSARAKLQQLERDASQMLFAGRMK